MSLVTRTNTNQYDGYLGADPMNSEPEINTINLIASYFPGTISRMSKLSPEIAGNLWAIYNHDLCKVDVIGYGKVNAGWSRGFEYGL